MSKLNLVQSGLGVDDVLTVRLEDLLSLETGRMYHRTFRALQPRLQLAIDSYRSTADPKSELVAQHVQVTQDLADIFGGRRRDPLLSAEQREAADRLYEAVVDKRLGPNHKPTKRAEYASIVRGQLDDLAPDLAQFPPEVTQMLNTLLDVGDAIGKAVSLSKRGRREAERPASLIREAMSAFSLLRTSIRVQVQLDPNLPEDIEERILGYVDELLRRNERSRNTPEVTVEAPVPEAAPSETPEVDVEALAEPSTDISSSSALI